MLGIDKRFPGVQALAGVDFEVRPGEVHALMGQNGAGKSTLIKVLTGVHRRDAGTIRLDGRPFRPANPAEAQRQGIYSVYQEINLVPSLSVAENLLLGRFPRRWWGIDWRKTGYWAEGLLEQFDLDIDVDRPLGSFPAAIQQMVAIVRAVDREARLLILDEPTSSLDRREAEILFGMIERLKARQIGIIFITHFLHEVYRISDRITVLRNGRLVGTFNTGELPRIELVAHMLGEQAPQTSEEGGERAARRPAEVVSSRAGRRSLIAVTVLKAFGLGKRGRMAPFDLDLYRGEVLGLAGLLGSGRTETGRLLFGADRSDRGHLEILGQEVTRHDPRRAIASGMGLCPEDRQSGGIIPDMSVRGNIALVVQRRLSRFGVVSRRRQERLAREIAEQLGIVELDLDKPVRFLSGGNQQKVILARWLVLDPLILILDEPTRGIDVGAKVEIELLVERLAASGTAIVFISTELEEVVRRSHRLLILRDRKIVGELTDTQMTIASVMQAVAAPDSHDD